MNADTKWRKYIKGKREKSTEEQRWNIRRDKIIRLEEERRQQNRREEMK